MSDFLCQSCGHVIRADCPARVNAEYSREPNPCVPVDANEIERLRARVAELEAAQEWRPIESAPRDGSRMLLALCDSGHVYWCVSGVWSKRFKNWNDGMEPAGLADPTHWMPLPAPPKVAT